MGHSYERIFCSLLNDLFQIKPSLELVEICFNMVSEKCSSCTYFFLYIPLIFERVFFFKVKRCVAIC